MKKIILFVCILVSIFSLYVVTNYKVSAKTDLDRILLYEIDVDPVKEDGSLNIHIIIDWKVLDDKTDGPLTWVKIGVVNYHVSNIKAISSNIKKIKYYSDDGSFIRIDLDRKYYAGETLRIEYEYNQSYVYRLKDDLCFYDYNPGYFDEIYVEKCILKWNTSSNPILQDGSSPLTYTDASYNVFEHSLSYGGYIKVKYVYNQTDFTSLDPDMQYTSKYMSPVEVKLIICVFIGIFGFIIFCIVMAIKSSDPYERSRGFYGTTYYRHHYFYPHGLYARKSIDSKGHPIVPPSSGNSSSGHGGGFSCACACACAGGGRAGCSKKDFYNTNLDSKKIIESLNK